MILSIIILILYNLYLSTCSSIFCNWSQWSKQSDCYWNGNICEYGVQRMCKCFSKDYSFKSCTYDYMPIYFKENTESKFMNLKCMITNCEKFVTICEWGQWAAYDSNCGWRKRKRTKECCKEHTNPSVKCLSDYEPEVQFDSVWKDCKIDNLKEEMNNEQNISILKIMGGIFLVAILLIICVCKCFRNIKQKQRMQSLNSHENNNVLPPQVEVRQFPPQINIEVAQSQPVEPSCPPAYDFPNTPPPSYDSLYSK